MKPMIRVDFANTLNLLRSSVRADCEITGEYDMEGNKDVNEKNLGRNRVYWCQWEEVIGRLSVLEAEKS